MRSILANDINSVLNFPGLVDCLKEAFRSEIVSPVRHHHTIDYGEQADATLLIMPAWSDFQSVSDSDSGYIGIKLVTVFPDNHKFQKPSIMGSYLLLSGQTGEPLAILDGQSLTLWRTATASALACSYLAREDSESLLMVGAGALAPYLIKAHSCMRPIKKVNIWNRNFEKAAKLASELSREEVDASAVQDIENAANQADIISCATMSSSPIILGEWLQPGTHLDLVGAFSKNMRESDDKAVKRSEIFVDTRGGALKEGGDIVQPIENGVISETDIKADLFELCRNSKLGRQSDEQITLFKSVGAALEDFATAQHIMQLTADQK